VWFIYKSFIRKKQAFSRMELVELTASNTLHALHQFEKASGEAVP